MSSSLPKKAKTTESSFQHEFAQVRRYLLACPFVKPDHPAIQGALKGLDQELKRQEREARLHSKFMQDAVTIEKPMATTPERTQTTEYSSKWSQTTEISQTTKEEIMTDDWQDVTAEQSPTQAQPASGNLDGSCSFLGQRLAKGAISTIADYGVKCQTPLEALALALHAAMRSEALGFACTGVPDSDKTANSGFAAPIRELPRTQFLPPGWNKDKDSVALRYRKNGTGAVVLQVSKHQPASPHTNEPDAIDVQVLLTPTNASEPVGGSLTFPLNEHINLESFNKALQEQGSVSPALHYKSLSTLMSKFAETFDLGQVAEDDGTTEAFTTQQEFPYVDTTVTSLPTRRQGMGDANMPALGTQSMQRPMVHRPPDDRDGTTPTTLDQAFPGALRDPTRGDFSGDLAPGGVSGPYFGGPGGVSQGGGGLMGPNHPSFFGGVAPPPAGLGMRPRFDPFGPPGGPMDPDNDNDDDKNNKQKQRPHQRFPGEPNPDHMRPPKDLGDNMFM